MPMFPEDYPPQEPFSEPARLYHVEVMRRGASIIGEELRYGSDPYQSMCVFRAAQPNGAVLAFFHGGGWTNGYKEWLTFMAPCLTNAGITFATVGYRLAPEHLFPAGFQDACTGVTRLVDAAAQFAGGQYRLCVGGHSAGGHYAALMALTKAALNIRGCLPISGVYDFGLQSGLSTRPRFLGAPELKREVAASPIEHVGPNPCSFLIAYGSEDFQHLMRQAECIADKLVAAGGDVERLVLNGRNHFTASYSAGDPEGPWASKAIEWVAQH